MCCYFSVMLKWRIYVSRDLWSINSACPRARGGLWTINPVVYPLLSLTSNFLINIAFSAPFGYSSLSNNSKMTPCECSVVEASISSLALQKRYINLAASFLQIFGESTTYWVALHLTISILIKAPLCKYTTALFPGPKMKRRKGLVSAICTCT